MGYRLREIGRSRHFMNTEIIIKVAAAPNHSTVEVLDAIEAAFNEFDRVVKTYTRFNNSSELSKINKRQGQWQPISEELYKIVNLMLELAEQSDGAFDPTVIDFLETYGYDKNYDFSKLNQPELDKIVQKLALNRPSWRDLQLKLISDQNELQSPQGKICLANGQRLDLGGVGKGWAIDLAAHQLSQFNNFMIDAGGDVRCAGINASAQPWRIGLRHKKQDIGYVLAPKSGFNIASSGSWARRAKNFHHLINPSTGIPANDISTVYVSSTTAAISDGWATALFVGGRQLLSQVSDPIHSNQPTKLDVLMITSQDTVLKTDNFPHLRYT